MPDTTGRNSFVIFAYD